MKMKKLFILLSGLLVLSVVGLQASEGREPGSGDEHSHQNRVELMARRFNRETRTFDENSQLTPKESAAFIEGYDEGVKNLASLKRQVEAMWSRTATGLIMVGAAAGGVALAVLIRWGIERVKARGGLKKTFKNFLANKIHEQDDSLEAVTLNQVHGTHDDIFPDNTFKESASS